jgi:hypothetical protein
MASLFQIQQQLKTQGSNLVDGVKEYNVLRRLTKSLELPNTAEFFNNPEKPKEVLQAENEQLTAQLQQAMGILQQQNPLAEAEKVKAQAQMALNQQKQELDVQKFIVQQQADAAKAQEEQRQFNATLTAKVNQQNDEFALKLTEMEQESGKQLDGELKQNMLTFDPAVGDFV